MSEAEQAREPQRDKNGRLLAGRYRLGEVLGRGGMGTVWRADDETLGRTVAVKELRFPSAIDEDEKRRLITRTLREAKAIARIRNNSAVTVYDVVDEDDRPWIVMELIEGKSLAEAIREDGTLTPRRAAEVGLAILDVLRSAHREGILHRDVKPSNVLIAEDGRVVLTDFGIAQVEGDPSVTSTGMLVGAPSYISPERARGHKPGPPADLWSLGGLLYASVEGCPPYDKGSAIATLTAVMTEPLDPPKNAGPLTEVIYGLLARDPDQRLDDAGARALLNDVINAPDVPAASPRGLHPDHGAAARRPPPTPSSSGRRSSPRPPSRRSSPPGRASPARAPATGCAERCAPCVTRRPRRRPRGPPRARSRRPRALRQPLPARPSPRPSLRHRPVPPPRARSPPRPRTELRRPPPRPSAPRSRRRRRVLPYRGSARRPRPRPRVPRSPTWCPAAPSRSSRPSSRWPFSARSSRSLSAATTRTRAAARATPPRRPEPRPGAPTTRAPTPAAVRPHEKGGGQKEGQGTDDGRASEDPSGDDADDSGADDSGADDPEDEGADRGDALPAGYEKVTDGRFHFTMAMPEGFKRTAIAGSNSGGIYNAERGSFPASRSTSTARPRTTRRPPGAGRSGASRCSATATSTAA